MPTSRDKVKAVSLTIAATALVLFALVAGSDSMPAAETDSQLASWVKDALSHDQRVDAGKLKVDAKDGLVFLAGHVPTMAARRFAILEAEKIDGVVAVIDDMHVDAEQRDDVDITTDVLNRINSNASIETKDLKVRCLDGVVSLSGEVSDYSEELEAELMASEVRGVVEVNNHLLTKFLGTQSDEQVALDVKASLARDVYLGSLPLVVKVTNREVTISGTVGSAFEKSRITAEVHQMEQVKAVDNRVSVDPRLGSGTRSSEPWPSDNHCEEAVKADLTHDSRIDAAKIEISAEYGMVTLEGSVKTYRERRQAEIDARDVVGVVSVANNLRIIGPACDDGLLQTLIASEFKSDAMLHRFEILVQSEAGRLILRGHVDTAYEKTHAADVAGHVRGVRDIRNDLEVTQEVALSDETLDQVIRKRLTQNRLTKSCAKEMKIEVLNGVAVLSGWVDSFAERKAAENVAFQTAGVWKVENRLVVEAYDYPWEDWQKDFESDFDPGYTPDYLFIFYV